MAGIELCPKHRVFLENSDVHRLKRQYRYLLPDPYLLDVSPRRAKMGDEHLVGLARLGEQLLSSEWPALSLTQLRANYLIQLEQAGFINGRGEVKMDALLQKVVSFYGRGLLERLGCQGEHWLVRILRTSVSIQQPIRHLLLLNCLGISLEDLFTPKPLLQATTIVPVTHTNLNCVNHLCPDLGKAVCEFTGDAQSSMLGGVIENYRCETCGQMLGHCCVGHERTWIRNYGPLWRNRLAELWADANMSLRDISKSLRVSCGTVRKHALKTGLSLERPGHQPLSVRGCRHLLVSKEEKRLKKVMRLRERWLKAKQQWPDFGTRGLRDKLPAVYATLCRYDRAWLSANQPKNRRFWPKGRVRVNWRERDLRLCEKLHTVANQLRNQLKPAQRLTPATLAKAVGLKYWAGSRLKRLPNSRFILIGESDTTQDFAIRFLGLPRCDRERDPSEQVLITA
jgi:hypothetical protein